MPDRMVPTSWVQWMGMLRHVYCVLSKHVAASKGPQIESRWWIINSAENSFWTQNEKLRCHQRVCLWSNMLGSSRLHDTSEGVCTVWKKRRGKNIYTIWVPWNNDLPFHTQPSLVFIDFVSFDLQTLRSIYYGFVIVHEIITMLTV